MSEYQELKAQDEEFQRKIIQCLDQIADRIPDNPNITRISQHPSVFSIPFSKLERRSTWSPLYYDFQYQADKIKEVIADKTTATSKINAIERIIQEKIIPGKGGGSMLHPDVIAFLKRELDIK